MHTSSAHRYPKKLSFDDAVNDAGRGKSARHEAWVRAGDLLHDMASRCDVLHCKRLHRHGKPEVDACSARPRACTAGCHHMRLRASSHGPLKVGWEHACMAVMFARAHALGLTCTGAHV